MAKDSAFLIFVLILEALEGMKLEFTKTISQSWLDRGYPKMAISLTY